MMKTYNQVSSYRQAWRLFKTLLGLILLLWKLVLLWVPIYYAIHR